LLLFRELLIQLILKSVVSDRVVCGGGAIAQKLAARLGWKLWDQALSHEIARMAEVDCSAVQARDEKLDGRLYRLTKLFLRGCSDRGAPVTEAQIFDTDCMVSMMETVTLQIAAQGNSVLVGRGAPYFLRHRNDTLHVFLYASRSEKLRRLLAAGKNSQEAETLVDTVDRERKAFVRHYFHTEWPTRALYHSMIGIGDDAVISIIVSMFERARKHPAGRETLASAEILRR
jgi:CMP/dCMP kinase